MPDLADRVRSALTDPHPIWESLLPDTMMIVRLCLGCRSDKSAEKRLLALGRLISASCLRVVEPGMKQFRNKFRTT